MVEFDIYIYLDYRQLLQAYYDFAKAERNGFSYRRFSIDAGIRSPSHLKLVINGDRKLTDDMAVRFAKAMALNGDDTEYFCAIVAFGNAKTQQQRELAHSRMQRLRGYRKRQSLDNAHTNYHANWWIPAIRELVNRYDFKNDPNWIAKTIVPNIAPNQAKKAMQVLFDLEMVIERDGKVVQNATTLVSTGPITMNVHVPRYHREMMGRAMESMDVFEKDEVDITSLTFCLGDEGFKRLKDRIKAFRRELIAFAQEEEVDGVQLVQVGFQAFPLSDKADPDPKKESKEK